MNYLVKLLTERSTYMGLLSLLTGLGLFVMPENAVEIAGALAMLVGSILSLTTDENLNKNLIKVESGEK